MRQVVALTLASLIAGCGGETEMPAANVAQSQASTPIVAVAESTNQASDNGEKAVSRETAVEKAARSQSPKGSDRNPSDADRYRAIGTEPFWAATVKGATLILERPDRQPIHYTISRHDDGKAVRYLGDGIAMTVTEGPCSDGMSDSIWSDRVAIAFGEGTLNGCGGVRDKPNER